MLSIAIAMVLSQAADPVKIVNPLDQSKAATITTIGAKNSLDVNCVSGCSGGAGGSGGSSSSIIWVDGGRLTADEGVGPDGGVYAVFVSGAASLPLPTGASTAAKQPALGAAGSASADVLSVQGIAAMTPLKVDGSGVTQPISGSITANAGTNLNTSSLQLDATGAALNLGQASTTSGQTGPLTQGATTTAAPTYVSGKTNPLSLTVGGGLRVDGSAVTQPVNGSVTANAGTNLNTSALALSATQTDGTQKSRVTDGTRDGTVKAGSTAAQAADTSLVVGLSPNSPLPTGSNVIGHTVSDTGSTTTVTGNITAVQATGTNLHAVLDTTSTTAVTQATGTNLHAVLDATSTTAATQATATSLKAEVVGPSADNSSNTSTKQAVITSRANAANPSWTEGNQVPSSVDLSGRQRTDVGAFGGAAISTGTGTGGVGIPRVTVSSDSTIGLAAGSQAIGHVVADTGSTTAITGNVTVVQPTGSNLHVVVDTAPSTVVTSANLDVALSTRTKPSDQQHVIVDTNAALVASSAVIGHVINDASSAVIGHVIVDTTSTTAATQATASNLNAQVQGAGASGAAKAGNPVQIGGVFNTSQPTVTNGQGVEAQTTARGALIVASGADAIAVNNTQQGTASQNVAQFGGTSVSTGTGTGGAGVPRVTVSSDSTVGVSGNVTVIQGTGTNLHVVVDTAPTTTVTQSGAPWTTTPPTGSISNDGACVSVTGNTTVLASNASRRQAALCARLSNSDTTFIKLAATATTSDFPLEPGQCLNLTAPGSIYTGIIDAIANTGTQSVCVLEVN